MPYGQTINLTGQRVGKLTVLHETRSAKKRGVHWHCQCDCGKTAVVSGSHLKIGGVQSCGCLRIKHGMWKDPVYPQWRSMLDRCYRKEAINYHKYGAVGVRVCEFLKASPVNVLILLGAMSNPSSIDRIKNEFGYYYGQCAECLSAGWPMNVRWATIEEQNQNRSITRWVEIKGERKCVSEWSRILGISRNKVVKLYGS